MKKQTLVIGAVNKANRYSYKAVQMLVDYNEAVIAFGTKPGNIDEVVIDTFWNTEWDIDTVTLYINPVIQESYYDQIIALNPQRVIFNPGTENEHFFRLLEAKKIQVEVACTLVLLSIGNYR